MIDTKKCELTVSKNTYSGVTVTSKIVFEAEIEQTSANLLAFLLNDFHCNMERAIPRRIRVTVHPERGDSAVDYLSFRIDYSEKGKDSWAAPDEVFGVIKMLRFQRLLDQYYTGFPKSERLVYNRLFLA